ncbi:putative mitochondrial carrier protein [Trypanosoma theileri]|uniref:Putative mitochondrial carrier protein n=1 Tax=Trypanosoma theileri TaxID=67003 RepID=A0A1X0NIA3_9TRYP|nr:putative mitochondrial carrier protein [Trypanosoma theileri]ORC84321.1 putative mitochondrial carrier protein [Trypanosoma theileri]
MDSEMVLAFLPGAAQGITSVVLGHPLDTAKTRMQALGPCAGRSFPRTMWNMARVEGVKSLYRGVTPPLLMSATKRSLQFAIWDLFRRQQEQQQQKQQEQQQQQENNDNGNSITTSSSYVIHCLSQTYGWIGASPFRAGAFAGAVGTLIGCPMHVIKIRTQFVTHNETRNAWTCALDIFRIEGLKGYYRGFRYQLLKDTLFASCYLGLYDVSKRWLQGQYSPAWGTGVADVFRDASAPQLAFLSGSLASMATWTLLYPLDTIKTMAQARGVGVFRGGVSIPHGVYGSGGMVGWMSVRGMYRGLGASLVKAGPVCGAAMVVYEWAKTAADSRRRRVQQQRCGFDKCGQ